MVLINLLPWRSTKLAYENHAVHKLVYSINAVVIIILLSSYAWIANQEQKLLTHLQEIKETLKRLENMQQVVNTQTAASDNIQHWLTYQADTHALLNLLNQPLTMDACLTAILRQQNAVMVTGHARSTTDLLAFIKQWQSTSLFADISIEQLQSQQGRMQFRFRANPALPVR